MEGKALEYQVITIIMKHYSGKKKYQDRGMGWLFSECTGEVGKRKKKKNYDMLRALNSQLNRWIET